MVRWHSSFLRLALCLVLVFAAPFAWAHSGRGGGDDDRDDRDSSDRDYDRDGPGDYDFGGESGSSGSDGGDSYGGDGGDSYDGGEGGEGGDFYDGGEGGASYDDDGGEGSSSSSGSSHHEKSDNAGQRIDHHEWIVVSRNDAGERVRAGEAIMLTSRRDITRELEKRSFRVVESFRLEAIGATALRITGPKGMNERQMINALHQTDPKAIVTFNHVYDPTGAGRMLAAGTSAVRPSVKAKVGLVDAAVDAKHPMLQRVVVNARSFDSAAQALPDAHGTAVASLIAEAAPGATVFAANVFSLSTDGREIATADTIVRGLDWLASMRIAVINLSLTGPANPILEAMVKRLVAKGHILVAAVGNEGPRGAPQYPAAYDKVVGVTAVDAKNRVYLYANQGNYVDFAAPGVDRKVAEPAGTTDTVSGTSYASPIVAARLARLIHAPDAARASQAVDALANGAEDLGAPGRDPIYGYGLIE